ncbi:MAG: DUF255 domain-containing protein [Nocardioidaceae bacterium]|nr:MAG: DUF255 domain-containing protein [Nocardioidaceae bacterium]
MQPVTGVLLSVGYVACHWCHERVA